MRRHFALLVVLTLAVTACGDSASEAPPLTGSREVAAGIEIYNAGCIACHGPEGVGVEGLGKSWVNSEFIGSRTEREMLAFLIEGRPSDHPENTTGISMMPRGGNPSLTDEDLLDLIAYMRTLNL